MVRSGRIKPCSCKRRDSRASHQLVDLRDPQRMKIATDARAIARRPSKGRLPEPRRAELFELLELRRRLVEP
jgi:hypothetical protein